MGKGKKNQAYMRPLNLSNLAKSSTEPNELTATPTATATATATAKAMDPPPANSTTMHTWMVFKDLNVCLWETAYLTKPNPITEKHKKILTPKKGLFSVLQF